MGETTWGMGGWLRLHPLGRLKGGWDLRSERRSEQRGLELLQPPLQQPQAPGREEDLRTGAPHCDDRSQAVGDRSPRQEEAMFSHLS